MDTSLRLWYDKQTDNVPDAEDIMIHEFMVRVCGADYDNGEKTFGERHALIAKEAERLGWQFDHLGANGLQLSKTVGKHVTLKHFDTMGNLILFLTKV